MKLNLRQPMMVIVGAWNPAILEPRWIATKIFDYNAGEKVLLQTIVEGDMYAPQRVINFVNNIGFCVEQGRLCLYQGASANLREARKQILEVSKKILDTLSHTPVAGFGLNFIYSFDKPTQKLLESFNEADPLKQKFRIAEDANAVAFEYMTDIFLNVKKVYHANGTVVVDFNFNHTTFEAEKFQALDVNYIQSLADKSAELLSEGYDVNQNEITVEAYEVSN